ncbi:MAG: hypothetical protein K2X64_10150 [Rhodocyclaceae bacterium]|nr:hypothetical protein [Rhodocyclaceae bacterium]
MGLVIVSAMALYLLISIFVVIGAVKHAKKTGKSAKRWGWGAVLVMYLIPFWDWIPTVAVHQYYCSTEAGYWVYKSVDQWKAENPGVMQTLVAKNITTPDQVERADEDNWKYTFILNQRINWTNSHSGSFPLHRWRTESTLVDSQTNSVLVRSVDFYTAQTRSGGGWLGWKFWLAIKHCSSHAESSNNFAAYLLAIKGVAK